MVRHNAHTATCIRAKDVTARLDPIATTALLLALLATGSTVARAGDLDKVVLFNIKAQTLDKALLQFGAQDHVQMSFAWDSSTSSLRTQSLKGRYSGAEALARLLKGTSLRYVADGHTVEVLPDRLTQAADPTRARPANSAESQNPAQQIKDPPASIAQSKGGQSPPRIHEIIVTAEKYRQRASDVPISLDVVDGQELLDHGITDLSNLQYDVPGVYMNSTGLSRAVYLRGVGNTFGTGPMVGQYIDEADITAGGFTGGNGYVGGDNGLYDLNRVEVLKGPQGTLYGDGSVGGVIRYITNRPALNQFQMSANVSALYTEYGAPSQDIETMLNTPLVDGTLGLRFAGMFEHDGGWVDEPAASLTDVNGSNLSDVRVEALWQPTQSLAVNATEIVHRHTWGLGTGEDGSGNITPLFGTTLTPNAADDSTITNVTASYDLGWAKLLSSSTHTNEHDDTHSSFASTPSGPITIWIMEPLFSANNESDSQELRLTHTGTSPWQWTVGAFYDHWSGFQGGDAYAGLAGVPLASAFYIPEPTNNAADASTSWATFADTSYRLSERLTLGVGARYFKDHESESSDGVPIGAAPFASTDPRFYVQYRVTSHISTYAAASKGFRSGGFNANPTERTFSPETLWSYDVGAKLRFPRHGVVADMDLFYMDYSNYVTYKLIPPSLTLLANVGRARIDGVDADLTWQPFKSWQFGLNTEILDTKFLTASQSSGYAPGDRLPFAPTYSFTGSGQRNFAWLGKPSYIELYYYEISRVQYRETGIPLAQSDVMHFLNWRLGMHWNANLTLALFANNLLNDRGNESPFIYEDQSVRPRPRTYGVNFAVSF